MRSTASTLLTVVAVVVGAWLALKLLGVAFKLVGVLILIGVAAIAYFGARRLIGKGR